MKRNKMNVIIIFLALLLCCICAAIVLYNLGFWSFPLPKRDFALRDLLLTVEDLGKGWSVKYDEGWSMYNSTILEQWNRHFSYRTEDGEALAIEHFVYRCDNKVHARSYLREARLYFGQYLPPPELTALFQPRYADEWMLECSKGGCGYRARYEEFYLVFVVASTREGPKFADAMASGYISYAQIAHWLRILDERVGRLLGKAP